MVNVLYLINKYSGNYPLYNAQAALDNSKFRTIVCYLSGTYDGNNGLEKQGCKAIYLNIDKKKARWYHYSAISKIRQIIEDENIHVINCHRRRATEIGIAASLLSRAKPAIFTTIHGLRESKSYLRKLKEFFINRKLAGIICISYAVGEYILKTSWFLDTSKVTVIQNGLPFEKFLIPRVKSESRNLILPKVTAKYWFGTIGRLSEVKNHKTLITAFAKYVETIQNSVLLIAGEGLLEADLKNLVDRYGIKDKVFFLGFITDIPEFLNALDVFVLPSFREGLCLALLEAMASGLPVITSNVGGIPEVFGKAEMGKMVEPSDTGGFEIAMKELISLPEKTLNELGANSRERAVTDFSSTRMTRDYEKLFQKETKQLFMP
ncbi:MAG: glycosyltransferase [Desulfobacterium sp.]|nr:glycosyltransferase [Desulfobacterium sp.]MBU3947663.1 glycosyltransferase [Pseudomonadota bacterium]MBU4011026.1 glycosyltransferase [Pseudomonadota bacterium]MBU4037571.1 glycosyltransferase [Pseudomonadota bacterium]